MSTSTTHADPPAPFSWWVVGELRAEMARRRVSGREVARRIGRPAATVDKWLSGRSSLTLDHLDELCRAVGTSTQEVVALAVQRIPAQPVPTGPRPTNRPEWAGVARAERAAQTLAQAEGDAESRCTPPWSEGYRARLTLLPGGADPRLSRTPHPPAAERAS